MTRQMLKTTRNAKTESLWAWMTARTDKFTLQGCFGPSLMQFFVRPGERAPRSERAPPNRGDQMDGCQRRHADFPFASSQGQGNPATPAVKRKRAIDQISQVSVLLNLPRRSIAIHAIQPDK